MLVEEGGDGFVGAFEEAHGLDGAVANLGDLRLADDVEFPVGELVCEADVLAFASDGEGELVVGDDDFHRLALFVDEYAADFGGCEGVADEARGVWAEGDDVDFFAAEFLHDGLDAGALHADAGADGVDVAVTRADGDFGAGAGFAGDGFDADDAFGDFGDLLLEEAGDEVGVCAREDDEGSAALAVDGDEECLYAVAGAVVVARALLATFENRFGATEVDDDVAFFEAAGDACDDFADAVVVLVVDHFAFGFAHALDDDLLCGLGGDASEFVVGDAEAEGVADLRFGVLIAGFGEVDLGFGVGDFVDDGFELEDFDVAGVFVELGFNDAVWAEALARGGDHRGFDGFNEHGTVETFVFTDLIDDDAEIGNHS